MWMVTALAFVMAAGVMLGQTAPPLALGSAVPPGDATRGKAVFDGKGECLTCHRVGARGSRFGPDLTDIGARASIRPRRGGPPGPGAGPGNVPEDPDPAGRARAQLERALVEPGAEILPQNRTVRLVTRSGRAITGRLLNQDTFNVLLIDTTEQLVSVARSDLREFAFLKDSSMPSYRDKLTREELADLISYMASLKGGNLP